MFIRLRLILLLLLGTASVSFSQENFDRFFFQFATDKTFQLSRIKFPLEYKTWKNPEEIGGEVEIKKILKSDWAHDPFYMAENYRPQIYDNFKGELRDTDERLFQWIGTETGVDVKYFFKRESGKWYLVRKEHLGH